MPRSSDSREPLVLDIAVLGLLNESPMHGYELRKRLSATLGTLRAFSYGSLYPTLRRLSEAGWITEEAPIDQPGAKRSRRAKRVYQLTADGKEHLAELLADVGPDAFDDDGFGARLALFAQTRSDIRMQILEDGGAGSWRSGTACAARLPGPASGSIATPA